MKEKNLDNFQARTRRQLKKIEPYISKILYLTSFTVFLVQNLVIVVSFSFKHIWDFFTSAHFFLIIVFIGSLPFYFYNTITGKIPSSKVQSFEMISSVILFIGSSVNNFLSQIYICIPLGNCYPGTMIVGLATLFIILYLTWILERGYNLYAKKYSKLTSQDFKRIEISLKEEILKIEDEIQENLKLIGEETREVVETLGLEYEKFSFKRLEKYSDLIEELFLHYKQLSFLKYNSEMMFYKAKGFIDDGEFEEGIVLLQASIKYSPSKSVEEQHKLAVKQHLLAVNLARIHRYEEAYKIFMEILKNRSGGRVRSIVNFDVLGKVLENLNHLEASVAAKERNYELLYNKLGLEAFYHQQLKKKRIDYIEGIILLTALALILYYGLNSILQ